MREIVTICVLLSALLATGHGAVLGSEVITADGSPMSDFDGPPARCARRSASTMTDIP